MYYRLTDQQIANIALVLSMAEVKGKDAVKVVGIRNIIQEKKTAPYYKIEDPLRDFLLETIDNVTIRGEFAFAIVSLQMALASNKALKSIPKEKKTKTAKRVITPEEPAKSKKGQGPADPTK